METKKYIITFTNKNILNKNIYAVSMHDAIKKARGMIEKKTLPPKGFLILPTTR